MIYTLIPGGISACLEVKLPDGSEISCIYLSETNGVVVGVGNDGRALFNALPFKVRAEVNKHFGTVFSLPLESRGTYLHSCVPFEVEVADG